MRYSNSTTKSGRDPLRCGLVGAGAIAQSYVQALEHCSEARLVAVADSRFDAAWRIGERIRCRSYDSVERMVSDAGLDVAIVCTPPVTHPDICVYLMEHKIHVLCEKPFAIDSKGAQRMLASSRQAGVIITMASKFRYVEDVTHAKSIIASGMLGDLILFENVFSHRIDMSSRWNSRAEISGGGVLIDNGTHSVDLMHYFLGPLAELHAVEAKRSQGLPVEDTIFLLVRSVNGVLCKVDLSWSVWQQRDSYLDICGTRGSVSVGWKKSVRFDSAHHQRVPLGNGYNKIQAFRSQIDNFARAIRGEEQLLITADDALESVNVIESAYQSLHEKQPVRIYRPSPLAYDSNSETNLILPALSKREILH